jgi:hypothetical protein
MLLSVGLAAGEAGGIQHGKLLGALAGLLAMAVTGNAAAQDQVSKTRRCLPCTMVLFEAAADGVAVSIRCMFNFYFHECVSMLGSRLTSVLHDSLCDRPPIEAYSVLACLCCKALLACSTWKWLQVK